MKIPNEWHEKSQFCELTPEEFAELQNQHEVGDELYLDDNYCECERYIIDEYHRCQCGNRRCYVVAGIYEGKTFFSVEVY
jgi:hypothetical protein